MTTPITIINWISWEEGEVKEESIGGVGGYFDNGMRWNDYAIHLTEKELSYTEVLRQEIIANRFRFGGDIHQEERVPLFSDNTVGMFSYRAWGDLMAAIWSTEDNIDYNYMDFYMGKNS